MSKATRLLRHALATHWRARLRFPAPVLDAIEIAVARAERSHAGQIRFAIETALHPMQILRDLTPRARAVEVFSALHVWDTEHNNGVLIYVQLADRVVEIVADRGITGRVQPAEWEAVCRLMEQHFRSGRFRDGAVAGVEAVGMLLSRYFPAPAGRTDDGSDVGNELPDRPALL
ncbi:MAG: TPM domain-containing protein [Steroidobacteraceae bacterium]